MATGGTAVVVHLAGSRTGDEDKAANLVRAAERAGTRHLLYISVVGADRIPVAGWLGRAVCYFASNARRSRRGCGHPAKEPPARRRRVDRPEG